MVRRVEVDAVPAGGEENLSAHAVGAVVIEEVGTLSPVGVAAVVGVVVFQKLSAQATAGGSSKPTQANVADGLILEAGRVVGLAVRVTRHHLLYHLRSILECTKPALHTRRPLGNALTGWFLGPLRFR